MKDFAQLPSYEDRQDKEAILEDKEGVQIIMELASLSANLLLVSFIAYLVATLFFGGAVKGAKSEASYKNNRWGKIAIDDYNHRIYFPYRLFHHTVDGIRTCSSK